MDEDGAKVQLGIWAAAHMARLSELCDGGLDDLPPFLPQILVQGHDWRLKMVSANGPTETVSCALKPGSRLLLMKIDRARRLAYWRHTLLVGDFHTIQTARAFIRVGRKGLCAVVY